MSVTNFITSAHCLSRAHCVTCLKSPTWRAAVGAPDVCPCTPEERAVKPEKPLPSAPLPVFAASGVDKFFTDAPCWFPGCLELRTAYQVDVAAAGATCSGCQATKIRKKFAKLVASALKSLI
jgi:hypothetical protein